jgi:hypothetical protein
MAAVELTKDEIERFIALEKERKSLTRDGDAKERAAKPLKEKIKKYIEEKGGSDRTTTHYGYVLALVPYRQKQVEWKNEFIVVAGEEKAVELQEAMPMTYSLSVEPAAAS